MKLEVIERGESDAERPPVLFVHGAWHGAWAWEDNFQPFLADRGYHTLAVSLRGHAGSEGQLRWSSITEYVDDVATVVDSLPRRPVLIGHSMGGYIVQRYLQGAAAPAAVLVAPVPVSGVLATTARFAWRHPGAFAKMNLTLSLGPAVGTPELAREVLLSSRVGKETAAKKLARIQSESHRAFLDMMIPIKDTDEIEAQVLVIAGDADHLFTVAEQHETAAAYASTPVIFPGFGHDLMLEPGWEEPAALVADWLEKALRE